MLCLRCPMFFYLFVWLFLFYSNLLPASHSSWHVPLYVACYARVVSGAFLSLSFAMTSWSEYLRALLSSYGMRDTSLCRFCLFLLLCVGEEKIEVVPLSLSSPLRLFAFGESIFQFILILSQGSNEGMSNALLRRFFSGAPTLQLSERLSVSS